MTNRADSGISPPCFSTCLLMENTDKNFCSISAKKKKKNTHPFAMMQVNSSLGLMVSDESAITQASVEVGARDRSPRDSQRVLLS